MRKIESRLIRAGILAGIVLLFGGAAFLALWGKEEEEERFSAVLYQYTESGWTSFVEGLRQAEKDYGVSVNLVTMARESQASEQLDLIRREIENGAQGILTAAVDSRALEEPLEAVREEAPVVTVETGAGGEIPCVSADDYEMGGKLGEQILKDNENKQKYTVAIIREFTERDSVKERYRGVTDTLKAAGVKVQDWQRGEGDFYLDLYLKTMYEQSHVAAIVALDKYVTEEMINGRNRHLLENPGQQAGNPEIYGIGYTQQVIGSIDRNEIAALVYQNDFNMGYQGLETLIRKARGEAAPVPVIDSGLVTKETLYEPENQRLLFPMI